MLVFSSLALVLMLAAPLAQDPPAPKSPEKSLTGAVSEEEFKAMHDLKAEKPPKPEGVDVTLESSAKAYLALPKDAKTPLPAVIVIHEWWGLNDHIKHWSDRLAASGYAALAVDLYDGKVATTRDEAMAAMRGVDDAKSIEHLKSADAFLKHDDRVKAVRIGSIGWCFGGGKSLATALAIEDLNACVMYYGQPVTDPAKLKAIHAPLCGVFGNEDKGIPPKTVDAFEQALTDAKVAHEIHRYDAPHAFANPSSPAYHEKEAGEAWAEVSKFLEKNLKKG